MPGRTGRNSGEDGVRVARRDLLAMRDEDQRVRKELVATGTLFDTYHERMEAVHIRNAARLDEILETHGWLDAERFGPDGEAAAWTILMHSISRPDVLRRGRDLLADAVAQGEARPDRLAGLEDRIRTLEGRAQVYGTILDWDEDGRLSPLPIESPRNVDERRAAAGLPPLADHVARCREEAASTGSRPPADPESKAAGYRDWLRRTGWR
jgi:hypothetical protein